MLYVNTLRPRQNGRHFPDGTIRRIFLSENVLTSLQNPVKCVSTVRINNKPALVQIMAWRRPGDKPLSEPMMVNLLTHICVTRPQWVNQWQQKVRFHLKISRFFSGNIKWYLRLVTKIQQYRPSWTALDSFAVFFSFHSLIHPFLRPFALVIAYQTFSFFFCYEVLDIICRGYILARQLYVGLATTAITSI